MFTFGARFPENVEFTDCAVTWGARAIWSGYTDVIDCVPDRQQRETPGREEPDQAAGAQLAAWGEKSWPKLEEWCKNISQKGYDVFLLEEGPFGLRATPNGSYGYLYIRAWKLTDKAYDRIAAERTRKAEGDVAVPA